MKQTLLKPWLAVAIAFIYCINLYADVPTGYYNAAKGKAGATLKTSLSELSYPTFVYSYGGGGGKTWEGFYQTDQKEGGVVWDMYSDEVRYYNGYLAVASMNIEHSLPKSWWGGTQNAAYKDLFHLYPSDATANNRKNNYPMGVVSGSGTFSNGVSKVGYNIAGTTYQGLCFEPADEYKGDFARSYFYMATTYEDFANIWNSPMMNNNTYPVWQSWALELLMEWHEQDPVSEKELARNEIVYGIQGNRNPFIDHPDLVDYIWGSKTTIAYPFPDENSPFLISPRAGNKYDMGIIILGQSSTHDFDLQASNLTADINLSLKVNTQFSLPANKVTKSKALEGTTFGITYTPTASGMALDTLVIASSGLTTVLIPISAIASSTFMAFEADEVSPVGGRLHWTADSDATDYKVSVYQGDMRTGNLMISGYVEGTSYNKAIELYNGTGATIDLSEYSLMKQSNGFGGFIEEATLSGMLAHNATYVVVHSTCNNTTLKDKANQLNNTMMNFNGNDAVALYHKGIQIEVVGVVNDANMWGENLTFERKSSVTHPTTQFDADEWDVYPVDYFDKVGSHAINYASTSTYVVKDKSVGTDNFYEVDGLTPMQYYTYSITAVKPSGNVKTTNTVQLRTTDMEAPQILDATDITSSSFTANWEDNPYIDDHLLSIYKLQSASSTDVFDFDAVGNNGKPLPDGWTGTASGNYTTTASSGNSPNSIALKSTGEYLQTNTFDEPITKLSFMYRYPSSGAGNNLAVETMKGSTWQTVANYPFVDMNRQYPELTFAHEDDVRAIRLTFTKVSGNLAIDDIEITSGASDTIHVNQNIAVPGTQYTVHDLTAETTYLYHVNVTRGSYTSPASESMEVNTLKSTGIAGVDDNDPVNFALVDGGVVMNGLEIGDRISAFSANGMQLLSLVAESTSLYLPLNDKGIFIIRIDNTNRVYKVIK